MATVTYSDVNDDVLGPLSPPRPLYFYVMAALAGVIAWALVCWIYQVRTGMGVAGINHPVGWGVYIVNFVFWVGIAHSGTLISAILHLVRSRWRAAISRAAEAMTVFAVMTAGLFPLVHLGRLWVFYYIIPYPSERQLWPDFMSPLVWDVCAVSTYFTVSTIFWYVGMIPDLAAARDRLAPLPGRALRSWIYGKLALGWCGSGAQWRHYGRSYLFFAALATPLVISVHSVVSWDFAMSILPGWHTTIFAPYFVAGAIHSGLAMVLTLLIPMRRLLRLERLITIDHFEAAAQTMIVTTLIVGYAYTVEPFMSWYSGDAFEQQFAFWRATGWIAPFFWALYALNVLAPIFLVFRKIRRSLAALFVISILVNIGMWLERFVIIIGSLSHDFLPHNWGGYCPTWVEISITAGSFAWFLFWFFGFSKFAPTVSISDVKETQDSGPEKRHFEGPPEGKKLFGVREARSGVLAVYPEREKLLAALQKVRDSAFSRIETFSPVRLEGSELILGRGSSPVRLWTLIGALCGLTGGFALAIGSALVNALYVGGKPPVSIIPYCIVGFEGTILFGTIGNLIGMILHSRLGRSRLPAGYDPRVTCDRYGLMVACEPGEIEAARSLLQTTEPEDLHAY